MPQVDLEALVSSVRGSSDGKIAADVAPDDSEISCDFPPESFWLSGDAELDWFDRNAVLERKESTKRNSTNLSRSNSKSNRFSVSLKSKTSIIGLPKTQKNNHVDKRRNTKQAGTSIFPVKRSESTGKGTAVLMTEPSSPNVSCIGRVRSKRGRRRKPSKPEKVTVKSTDKTRSTGGEKKKGIRSALMSIFHAGRGKPGDKIDEPPSVKSSLRKSRSRTCKTKGSAPVGGEVPVQPPGLGGMTRFVSGRRSESWDAELDNSQ